MVEQRQLYSSPFASISYPLFLYSPNTNMWRTHSVPRRSLPSPPVPHRHVRRRHWSFFLVYCSLQIDWRLRQSWGTQSVWESFRGHIQPLRMFSRVFDTNPLEIVHLSNTLQTFFQSPSGGGSASPLELLVLKPSIIRGYFAYRLYYGDDGLM